MRNLLLACAGIIAFSALAHAGPLAPKDIQATFFTGQPFTASTPKGIKYKMVFTADGKVVHTIGGWSKPEKFVEELENGLKAAGTGGGK